MGEFILLSEERCANKARKRAFCGLSCFFFVVLLLFLFFLLSSPSRSRARPGQMGVKKETEWNYMLRSVIFHVSE